MSKSNRNNASPADTPSNELFDPGKKSKIKPEDKIYRSQAEDFGDIAEKKEKEEQPVYPIKKPPKSN